MDCVRSMDCDELADHLTDLLEGELAPELEAAALEHLAGCSRCELILAETRDIIEVAKEYGRVVPSDVDRQRMRTRLDGALGDLGSSDPQ